MPVSASCLQQRHAEHYADLAAQLQAQQRGGDLGGALVRLDQDEADFRASLRRTLDARQLTTAARLVGGLGFLWYSAGQHREGLQWCDDLFALEPDLSDQVLADALHSHGSLLGVMGQTDRAIEALERQVEIRRRLSDRERLGAALNNLGRLVLREGPLRRRRASARRSNRRAAQRWDLRRQPVAGHAGVWTLQPGPIRASR